MLRVLIVDDEAPAHDVMLHHVGVHDDLTVVGHCYNAAEALTALETLEVDLMLLDIRMPGFGGLDLLRGLKSPPITIIASAHRDHAVDGFDLDVVDYLLKPVSAERFAGALDKVRRRIDEQGQREEEAITLKVDRAMRRIDLADIACIQGQGNFVSIRTGTDGLLATATLRSLEEALPDDRFVRIHKSYIVNRTHVREQRAASLLLDTGDEVPIGKSYRGRVEILDRARSFVTRIQNRRATSIS